MQGRNLIRAILFVLFFSIGAGSLSVSILCKDLVQHYQNADLLRAAEESLDRLRSLNSDYAVVIERLQADPNDPNAVKHLARVTLGPEHQEPNTVYPRPTAELLAAARRAMAADSNDWDFEQAESMMPLITWPVVVLRSRPRIAPFEEGSSQGVPLPTKWGNTSTGDGPGSACARISS